MTLMNHRSKKNLTNLLIVVMVGIAILILYPDVVHSQGAMDTKIPTKTATLYWQMGEDIQAIDVYPHPGWNYLPIIMKIIATPTPTPTCICQSKSRPLYKRKTNHFGKIKIKNTIKKSTILQLKNRPLRMSLDVIEFQHPIGG